MTPRPNVILITTDQHRGDCLGLDKRNVKTPHIDTLAQRGARFTKCISPHPMCQPARASILTGKLPYTHGVRDNGRNLDPEIGAEGLGGMFAGAGYATHFIGKAHLASNETFHPTGTPECYHSTADFPADWGGPYFGFSEVELMLRPHHHCVWSDAPYTLHYENFLNADGQGRARWDKAKAHLPPETSHFQAWRSALEEPWHSTPWIGERAVDLIERKCNDPFFAWVSFPDPHPPFLAPEPGASHYDPDDVDIPANHTPDLETRPWWHRAFIESPVRKNIKRPHAEGGTDWGKSETLTERQIRDITAIYYGMITAIDHQIGRIVDALSAAGTLDKTIIVFCSDHGEWLGDHGLLLKGPMLYDGLLRVPLVLAGPEVPVGVFNEPVSTLDLRSTFADLCGISASPDNGRSLVPTMASESRDFALNEWEVDSQRSGIDLDLRTVRSQRYRMSVDLLSGAGELYDLQEDPDEMVNRFEDVSARTVRHVHLDMLQSRSDDMIPAAQRVGWH